MESASQSDLPPQEPASRWSSLLGILIAILTLTLPVFVIGHFSSARMDALENPAQTFNPSRK